MVCAGVLKPLWADAIELEAYVWSHTAHDIYSLQGEVPETVMSGETVDISQVCEFAFYDWVMFCDEPVAFPDANPVIDRYLGPAIDVGPALTAKILKANGEAVYRSTYRHLTDTEVQNAAHVLNLMCPSWTSLVLRRSRMISWTLTSLTPQNTITLMTLSLRDRTKNG
jgi:hypothetical protein